jgi:hypothetical protein
MASTTSAEAPRTRRSDIPSQSGMHDVHVGDPLPDTLSAFSPAAFRVHRRGCAALCLGRRPHRRRRRSRATPAESTRRTPGRSQDRFVFDYGLRWEIVFADHGARHRTSGFLDNPPAGSTGSISITRSPATASTEWRRPASAGRLAGKRHFALHAGIGDHHDSAQYLARQPADRMVPFAIYPHLVTSQARADQLWISRSPRESCRLLYASGQERLRTGNSKAVPANTVLDIDRYQRDLAGALPRHATSRR